MSLNVKLTVSLYGTHKIGTIGHGLIWIVISYISGTPYTKGPCT